MLESALNAPSQIQQLDAIDLASFQRRLRNSCNEAAIVQSVLPKLVSIDSLLDDDSCITVPNQQWDKECGLHVPATAQYRIPPPKPDQTIGLAASTFANHENALAYLAHKARPIKCLPSLVFPLIAIEAKGDRGQNVCRSQNLHNAAVILSQLVRLWEDTDSLDELLGKSLACTISITTQTCAISHFWLEAGIAGSRPRVRGGLLRSWSLNVQTPTALHEIVSCIERVISFTIERGARLIRERLEILENIIVAMPSPSCSPSCRKRKRSMDELDQDVEDYASPIEDAKYLPRPRRKRMSSGSGSRRSSGGRSSRTGT